MFTKALILVLLGSSLVLAAPVGDPDWTDSVKEWYEGAVKSVKDAFDSASETVNEYYEKFKSGAAYAGELGEDALAYLKVKATEAKDATLAKIKSISEDAAVEVEKIKSSAGKTAEEIAHEAEEIAKKTKDTIAQILAAAKQKWDETVKGAKNESTQKTEK